MISLIRHIEVCVKNSKSKFTNLNYYKKKKYILLLFVFSSLAIVSCEKEDDHDDHDGHDHASAIIETNNNIA